jgi:sulfatase maturation enzyme AslB (radical SAM superfamily)
MSHAPLRMLTLALTGECNLRCRYCYQNAKSGVRMPWTALKAAVDRVLESTSPRVDVIFAGGEPLLAFDLIERAVGYLEHRRPAGLGVQFSLGTNGTLLGSDTIAFLDRHQFEIELSFDGVPPAQAVRGRRSFARIDGALDRLRDRAPSAFWRRLTVGATLDAAAVPYLAESCSYFLEKHVQAVGLSPAAGQSARWTPAVLEELERQLDEVYRQAQSHYLDTGQVPLTAFRKVSNGPAPKRRIVCGAAAGGSVTVDVDGQVYACPMLAESSQRFANPGLAAIVQSMRMGSVSSPAFWQQLAALPGRARATGIFQVGPRRHSLHGQCIRCPYVRECHACPIAALSEPDHDSAQRIPDYLCAFNWTLMGLRRRFPAQPGHTELMSGRPPAPTLLRASPGPDSRRVSVPAGAGPTARGDTRARR